MRTSPPPGARFATATASPSSPRPSPLTPPHLQFTCSTKATPGRAGVFFVTATPAQMADVVTLRKCPGRLFTCKSSQKSVATSTLVVVAAVQQMITPRTALGGPRGGRPDRLRPVGKALAPEHQGMPTTAADATRKRRPSQASHLAFLTKATRQIFRKQFH